MQPAKDERQSSSATPARPDAMRQYEGAIGSSRCKCAMMYAPRARCSISAAYGRWLICPSGSPVACPNQNGTS